MAIQKLYVTPKDFNEAYNKSLEKGEPTKELLDCFTKIAKKFIPTLGPGNKCDQDACVNYAVTESWIKWKKFDYEVSSNYFSFFTTMIANDLRTHYNELTKGKDSSISIDSLFTANK